MTVTKTTDADDLTNSILPYSLIVGQDELKTALEIASVVPAVGGVLISGQRGTAKTTTVRSFALMFTESLPTTLPIGVTDDRVLSGWKIKSLIEGKLEPRPGLLQEASESAAKMLYIDEVNLLDDYMVNIILDALSTKILTVDRDHLTLAPQLVKFTLVGTMNPDEGWLRPQLLDRFALMTEVPAAASADERRQVLETVARFDLESEQPDGEFIASARQRDRDQRARLIAARERAAGLRYRDDVLPTCAKLAFRYEAPGHRGELALLRAARAVAALEEAEEITVRHVRRVAKLALIHRRGKGIAGSVPPWTPDDSALLDELIPEADS
jgi:magnesium chelatase subunit I